MQSKSVKVSTLLISLYHFMLTHQKY